MKQRENEQPRIKSKFKKSEYKSIWSISLFFVYLISFLIYVSMNSSIINSFIQRFSSEQIKFGYTTLIFIATTKMIMNMIHWGNKKIDQTSIIKSIDNFIDKLHDRFKKIT